MPISVLVLYILHFSHRSRHISIVSFSSTKGVVISLTLFHMTNIPKIPVLSALSVLYYGQSKKPNGN